MSQFSGSQSNGASKKVKERKRKEAEERNLKTIAERRKAARREKVK